MDPFTITATCVGLIAAIAQLSSQINTFATRVKEARKDMQDVLQELAALSANLEQMRDDQSMKQYPVPLRQNLLDSLKNCDSITKEMGEIVRKLSSTKIFGRFQWSLSKRDKLVSLKTKLEGHKSTISMALMIASIFLTVEVKNNTTRILDDTAAIKFETAQLPAQITSLYQCMGSLQLYIKDLQYRGDSASGNMFQNVFDNTTAYTASVLGHDAIGATSGRRSSDDFFDAQESFTPHLSQDPRFRIAIDFGMTCTAVCWSDGHADPLYKTVSTIQNWPGGGNFFSSKVPCLLAYKRGRLASWGYLVEDVEDDHGIEIYDNFKNSLSHDDSTNLGPPQVGQTFPEGFDTARRLCLDFFAALHDHIGSSLNQSRSSWQDGDVEILFSTPPTWKAKTKTNFLKLVKEAGFASGNGRPGQIIFLTEAEAAFASALEEARGRFSEGNIILVIDLGGRTTKLTTLHVYAGGQYDYPKVREIDSVAHDHVGSVAIDDDFQRLVVRRLTPLADQLPQTGHSIEKIARKMTKGRFQLFKADFGNDGMYHETQVYRIPVPGLEKDFEHQDAKIKRGCFELTIYEMCQLFDAQVRKILSAIDKHLDGVLLKMPELHLTHITVSGGLANSSYVIDKLRSTYQRDNRHPFTRRLDELLVFRQPELVIAKGMLLYQRSFLARGAASSVSALITRVSYGIVRNQLYDPHIHRNQDIFRDEVDGQIYARNQIQWVVKKRFDLDRLKNNQLELPMVHRVSVSKPIQPWKHTFVTGTATVDAGPAFLGQRGVGVLAELICDSDMVSHISHKTPLGTYEEIHYSIVLLFTPSSIGFEVKMDGTTYGSVTINTQSD